jgi:2',3'-cyclic-nucleotide 2'-phosphodiesterase
MSTFNVLMFGDIVGKPGRKALLAKLPELKRQLKPDLIIANAENLSHGFGVTEKALLEMQDAGVDFFTSGNHVFEKTTDLDKLFQKYPLIRPANMAKDNPGPGYKIFEVGTVKVLIINLIGQMYFKEHNSNPFKKLDEIFEETKYDKPAVTIIDFHSEVTSEKKSLGWYADGRASLFVGTHTHVATSDEDVLPKGTGYITDMGMVGMKYSSLGIDFENIIKTFVTEEKYPKVIHDHGLCTINGIFAKINLETGKTAKIKRVVEDVEV